MRNRLKKISTPIIENCKECNKKFESNSDSFTIRHGEYLSSGLHWFCNEDCSENYIIKNGY